MDRIKKTLGHDIEYFVPDSMREMDSTKGTTHYTAEIWLLISGTVSYGSFNLCMPLVLVLTDL